MYIEIVLEKFVFLADLQRFTGSPGNLSLLCAVRSWSCPDSLMNEIAVLGYAQRVNHTAHLVVHFATSVGLGVGEYNLLEIDGKVIYYMYWRYVKIYGFIVNSYTLGMYVNSLRMEKNFPCRHKSFPYTLDKI